MNCPYCYSEDEYQDRETVKVIATSGGTHYYQILCNYSCRVCEGQYQWQKGQKGLKTFWGYRKFLEDNNYI